MHQEAYRREGDMLVARRMHIYVWVFQTVEWSKCGKFQWKLWCWVSRRIIMRQLGFSKLVLEWSGLYWEF